MENTFPPIEEPLEPIPDTSPDVPPLDIPVAIPANPIEPKPVAIPFIPTRPRAIPTDPKEKQKAALKATRLRKRLRENKRIKPEDHAWLVDYDGGERDYTQGGDLRSKSTADRPIVPPLNLPPNVKEGVE